MPQPTSYAHAPRLPEGPVDLGALVGSPGTPVEIEVGPGRGAFALERLAAVPAARLIGFEIKRKWAAIVDERLRSQGLGERGRIFFDDIRLVLPRLVDHSVSIAYFHFPDPWWKKRHEKRLVLTSALLDQLARVLVPAGEVFVQTDVEERALAYESTFERHEGFRPFGESARIPANPYLAMSPRERRATRDGLPVFRLRYARS